MKLTIKDTRSQGMVLADGYGCQFSYPVFINNSVHPLYFTLMCKYNEAPNELEIELKPDGISYISKTSKLSPPSTNINNYSTDKLQPTNNNLKETVTNLSKKEQLELYKYMYNSLDCRI